MREIYFKMSFKTVEFNPAFPREIDHPNCKNFLGANTGIGKETAIDLAKRGARVIICCRDMTRADNAAKDIRSVSGSDLVETLQLDLASFKSIRKCAETLLEKEDKIDYLINNAGIIIEGFDPRV